MRDDELEKLLQAGLQSYGKAEPLSGLEERVLRRVQEEHPPRRWVWVRWATASACACVLVAVVGYKSITPIPHKPVEPAQSGIAKVEQGSKPSELVSTSTSDEPIPPAVHRRETKTVEAKQNKAAAALPKLDVFPIPHSLTPEERAMLQFVNQDPKAAKEVLAQIGAGSPEQIQIAQIQIEPLKIGGSQQEETNAKDQ